MKILSVSTRRKGLSAITTDEGGEFLVDTELLAMRGLAENSQIEDIEKLLFESDFKRAKSRALWYLSRRDHSEKELKDKLIKGGFSPEASIKAVERMCEMGLVDDRTFAKRFFEQMVAYNHSSTKEAVYKLKQKGISIDIIKELEEESEFDESENIKLLIERKYANRLKTEKDVEKVFAALVRKGFSFSDVRRALKQYSEKLECEDF